MKVTYTRSTTESKGYASPRAHERECCIVGKSMQRLEQPGQPRAKRQSARAAPLARAAPKRGQESQKDRDDRESEEFWRDYAADAAVHAAKSEKAAKIIRDTVVTRKAAGRTAPTKVTYTRSTTESSNVPLKKTKARDK